ncbi:hypothetical protein EV356DRAFT_535718 [Viridothelium virens]|uniref:Uncharacterized protein n=1 Tax=Viridothelium virens TaxID=1048519 RepID=A0A6A6GZE3_VIRVR|nr:hypothetical protein EV356DRAFT_535718 [Viridothelium virens]
MPSTTTIVSVLAGIIALTAAYIYVFGIPPHLKRRMEETALEKMGENKASYIMKDQISKLPASDQKDVKDLQKGLGNALGGALQNPLGKQAGDTGDKVTSPLTGR